MRKVICIIACLIAQLSSFAQSGRQKDYITIREAMSIVSYRRYHPMMEEKEFVGFIMPIIKKHGYREEDFLEGIGTCSFWQFIKNGHVLQSPGSDDYDLFVPDNLLGASTVAVVDCEGIETIENDETAISVEITVYAKNNYDELMKELHNIGFTYSRNNDKRKEYVYQSYTLSVYSGFSRGQQYWNFEIQLNARDYNSAKIIEFADSSRIHNLKIHVDYPVKGSPVLLRRIRTFVMEALEQDLLNGWPMGRYSGDASDGLSVINYYGRKGVAALKEKHSGQTSPFKEETTIRKVAENDSYVSYEVYRYGWYGGVDNYRCYGATYRKSDGKRLHVIANPKDPQFKQFLNNNLIYEKKDELLNEYKNNIPMPKYEPFLIQSGVRFIYQQYEIAPGAADYIKEDASYPIMRPFLSEEAKDVIKGFDNPNTINDPAQTSNGGNSGNYGINNHVSDAPIYDVVEDMPQFPNGPQALFDYLYNNLKYPVVAEENRTQGRVIVAFVVERDGSISNAKIIKSVDPELDLEALRLVKSMPRWTPGMQNGSVVRVKYTVPVTFKLDGPKDVISK